MDQTREMMNKTDDLQRQLMAVTGEAWSDDRMIKAVVGPRGQLVELEIDPRIYRKPNSSLLSKTIIDTTQRAAAEASRKAGEIIHNFAPADIRQGTTGGSRIEKLMARSDADLLKGKEDRR